MGNPCREETLLSAYMDGALSQADTQQVRRHLESCKACRQQLADLQATDGLLQKLEPLEPSPGFEHTFWRKVAELEEASRPSWWARYTRPVWRPALAAGVAAGLIAGVLIFNSPGTRVSPEDRFMADNVEFLTEYDLIHNLDLLEDWEAIEAMKASS